MNANCGKKCNREFDGTSDYTVCLYTEDVGLPELKGMARKIKKSASNPRKNIVLTDKEIESSFSPQKNFRKSYFKNGSKERK
ncbi:hypothetical protein TNCV_4918201 [Trichonephila clavipes]|nr:hypothetical protein TNCV_4918201 [Trichonephila clavipes]